MYFLLLQNFDSNSNSSSNDQVIIPANIITNTNVKKIIPRLIDSSGPVDTKDLVPNLWSVDDVAQFLRINDCSAYSDSFVNQVMYLIIYYLNYMKPLLIRF